MDQDSCFSGYQQQTDRHGCFFFSTPDVDINFEHEEKYEGLGTIRDGNLMGFDPVNGKTTWNGNAFLSCDPHMNG